MQPLAHIVDLSANPIDDVAFQARCKATLDTAGALVLPGFLTAAALATIRLEGPSIAMRRFMRPASITST